MARMPSGDLIATPTACWAQCRAIDCKPRQQAGSVANRSLLIRPIEWPHEQQRDSNTNRVARIGPGHSETPNQRAVRHFVRGRTWMSEAGYVSSGYVHVAALREKLKALAPDDDDLDQFSAWSLHAELSHLFDSDEWREHVKKAKDDMLNKTAGRLLKNAQAASPEMEQDEGEPVETSLACSTFGRLWITS